MDVNLIPTLESDELLLRPWLPEFAEDSLRIFGEKEVTDSCGIAPVNTISDARAKLRAFAKSKRTEWSIALKNGGNPIIVRIVGGNTRSERTAVKCGYRYHSQKKIGTEYRKTYIKVFDQNEL